MKNNIPLSNVLAFPFRAEVPPGLQGYLLIQQLGRAFLWELLLHSVAQTVLNRAGWRLHKRRCQQLLIYHKLQWGELRQPHNSLLRPFLPLMIVFFLPQLSPALTLLLKSWCLCFDAETWEKKKKLSISLVPCNYLAKFCSGPHWLSNETSSVRSLELASAVARVSLQRLFHSNITQEC